jgi:glycosyltransferase involved in cell wall biosynthesis
MKIVFLAPFGIRPKGTVVARMLPLASELQLLGNEVVIIAPPYTNPEDSGKVETLGGVLLRNIRLGPYHKVLAAPVLAMRMFSAALREKPDFVHLFKPKGYGGLAAMLLLAFRSIGIPVPRLILDTDDWEGPGGMNELHEYSPLEKRFYRFQEEWLICRAAGVTVASRCLETIVRGMGVNAERVLYLPNCVGGSRQGNGKAVRQRLGIDEAAPVVLLYTRFFEFPQEKLHFIFAEIHRNLPDVVFLVVGKGRNNEEDLLVRKSHEMGFAKALVMAGWVDPVDLPDFLATGDLAIYPFADTLLNRCKCPAKFTELLLAGIPVIADRVGQVIEYMPPGSAALLCNPDDWQEMTSAALTLLCDVDRRRVFGDMGKSNLLANFSWRDYAAKLHDFYGSM